MTLGWKTDANGEPIAWLRGTAPSRAKLRSGVVSIEPSTLTSHTAIVAQSGSGKSFLLGRLVEELLIRTRARCAVIDPNGDFRVSWQVVDGKQWTDAAYDVRLHEGYLHTERDGVAFSKRWQKMPIRIESQRRLTTDEKMVSPHHRSDIAMPWAHAPIALVADAFDAGSVVEVTSCHNFLGLLCGLLGEFDDVWPNWINDRAAVLEVAALLMIERDVDRVTHSLAEAIETAHRRAGAEASFPIEHAKRLIGQLDDRGARNVGRLLDPVVVRRYIAAARLFADGRFVLGGSKGDDPARLTVIDIASAGSVAERLAVASAAISRLWTAARREWERATDDDPAMDQRTPTFLVVDEVHHLAPQTPEGGLAIRVLQQMRELATEGRKFGIALIVATQRPDRLDPIVAGECANVALMRLNSNLALTSARELFGIDAAIDLQSTRSFRKGRCLLVGQWSGGIPTSLYVAARRTVEGGRNIPKHWLDGPKPLGGHPKPAINGHLKTGD